MEKHVATIVVGVTAGVIARILMLRSDYRRYPTYPHGYVTHLSLGFIAAALGAVAIPALAKPDYVAVTFLALAAQQFREVRNMERESLDKMEQTKLVRRGPDYIEGIARVFEARNYLVIATSMAVSGAYYVGGWLYGLPVMLLSWTLARVLMGGEFVGDIAEVVPAPLHMDKSLLMVGDIVIMNVGFESTRARIMKEGLGVILKPKNDDARLTLDNPGQRQAILHDVAFILGTKVDVQEVDFPPLARKNPDTGEIGIFVLPNEPDMECFIQIVKRIPVLESAKAKPLSSYYGRKAAD